MTTKVGFGKARDLALDLGSGQEVPLTALVDGSGNPITPARGVPFASSVVIVTAQTAASGANWTAFGAQACTALDIVNQTGADIEYRRGGAGNSIKVPTGTSRMVIGITDASSISVRRVDQTNTQVTVSAEAIVA